MEIIANDGQKMVITGQTTYEEAMMMMREYSENGLTFDVAFCRDDGSIAIYRNVRTGGTTPMNPVKRVHLGGQVSKRLFKSDGKIPLTVVDSEKFITPFRWGLMGLNGKAIF